MSGIWQRQPSNTVARENPWDKIRKSFSENLLSGELPGSENPILADHIKTWFEQISLPIGFKRTRMTCWGSAIFYVTHGKLPETRQDWKLVLDEQENQIPGMAMTTQEGWRILSLPSLATWLTFDDIAKLIASELNNIKGFLLTATLGDIKKIPQAILSDTNSHAMGCRLLEGKHFECTSTLGSNDNLSLTQIWRSEGKLVDLLKFMLGSNYVPLNTESIKYIALVGDKSSDLEFVRRISDIFKKLPPLVIRLDKDQQNSIKQGEKIEVGNLLNAVAGPWLYPLDSSFNLCSEISRELVSYYNKLGYCCTRGECNLSAKKFNELKQGIRTSTTKNLDPEEICSSLLTYLYLTNFPGSPIKTLCPINIKKDSNPISLFRSTVANAWVTFAIDSDHKIHLLIDDNHTTSSNSNTDETPAFDEFSKGLVEHPDPATTATVKLRTETELTAPQWAEIAGKTFVNALLTGASSQTLEDILKRRSWSPQKISIIIRATSMLIQSTRGVGSIIRNFLIEAAGVLLNQAGASNQLVNTLVALTQAGLFMYQITKNPASTIITLGAALAGNRIGDAAARYASSIGSYFGFWKTADTDSPVSNNTATRPHAH